MTISETSDGVPNLRPQVSVLMAVFNESQFVEEAINSIQAQNISQIEIVVVDDQSTDDTYSKLEGVQRLNDNLVIARNKTKGKVGAFNTAYSLSSGQSIVLFGGDDILPPNSLSIRLSHLNQIGPTRRAAVFGRLRTFSEWSDFHSLEAPKKGVKGNHSGGLGIITRPLAGHVFPIPDELPSEDVWLGLACTTFAEEIQYIDDIVLHYRIHANNSVRRDATFSEAVASYVKRHSAERLFFDLHHDVIPKHLLERLNARRKAEEIRSSGSLMRLIFCRNLAIGERLRAARYINPYINWSYRLFCRLTGRLLS